MQSKIIHIEWEGPFSLDNLKELNNEESDYGVYQIYGSHPVYGSNVLLYIGKADQQTFKERISQQWWDWNQDLKQMQIYVGRLAGKATPSDNEWSNQIDLAEKLLIYAHWPALNSRSISSVPDDALRNVHIFNWGCHRDLLPEVSGARLTDKYDDMPGYDIYGKHSC